MEKKLYFWKWVVLGWTWFSRLTKWFEYNGIFMRPTLRSLARYSTLQKDRGKTTTTVEWTIEFLIYLHFYPPQDLWSTSYSVYLDLEVKLLIRSYGQTDDFHTCWFMSALSTLETVQTRLNIYFLSLFSLGLRRSKRTFVMKYLEMLNLWFQGHENQCLGCLQFIRTLV